MKRSKGILGLPIGIFLWILFISFVLILFVFSYYQYPQSQVHGEFSIPFAKTQKPLKMPALLTLSLPQLKRNVSVRSFAMISLDKSNTMDLRALAIFNAINQFRVQNGLPQVFSSRDTCSFAQTRAQEIVNNFNHNGFQQRIQNHRLPYQTYVTVVENLAMNTNYLDVLNAWVASPGHKENLLRHLQFGCVGDSGVYFTFEGLL